MPKTFYQYFSLRHKSETFNLTTNNSQITKTNCTKYLGVHLDNKLNWEQHVIKTEEKVNKNSHTILKILTRKKWGCSMDTLNKTYNTYMKPIITYGAESLVTAKDTTMHKLETI
jgi:hypothetical protein